MSSWARVVAAVLLGAAFGRAAFEQDVQQVAIKDDGGATAVLTIPLMFAEDRCALKLYGEPGLPGLTGTLYHRARRTESYEWAVRELALQPALRLRGTDWRGSFADTMESAGIAADDVATLMAAIEEGADAINKAYVKGGTPLGDLKNGLARVGRDLNKVRKQPAFAAVCVALADIDAVTTLGSTVVGAVLANALATDRAAERLALLRSVVEAAAARDGSIDPALAAALSEAETNIEASRSKAGAFALQVNDDLPKLVDSGVNLGVCLAEVSLKLSAPLAGWLGAPLLTYNTLRGVADQWQLAQDGASVARLTRLLRDEATRGGSDEVRRMAAYGEYCFYDQMVSTLTTGASEFRELVTSLLGRFGDTNIRDWTEHCEKERAAAWERLVQATRGGGSSAPGPAGTGGGDGQLVLAVDTSGSMEGPKMAAAREAARILVNYFRHSLPASSFLDLSNDLPCTLVLVHGLFSDAESGWGPAVDFLCQPCGPLRFGGMVRPPGPSAPGLTPGDVYAVTLPRADSQTFAEQAGDLAAALRPITEANHKPLLLIGHSMGGLAIRAYLNNHAPDGQGLYGIMTVGTPHLGSLLGYLYGVDSPGAAQYLLQRLIQLPAVPLPRGTALGSGRQAERVELGEIAILLKALGALFGQRFNLSAPAVQYLQPPDGLNELARLNAGSVWPPGLVYGEIVSQWDPTVLAGTGVVPRAYLLLLTLYAHDISRIIERQCPNSGTVDCSLESLLHESDGIVHVKSQAMSLLVPASKQSEIKFLSVRAPLRSFHTDETDHVQAIASLVFAMVSQKSGPGFQWKPNNRLGLVTFDSSASVRLPVGSTTSEQDLAGMLDALGTGGQTNIGDALRQSLGLLDRDARSRRRRIMLLSDGRHNRGTSPMEGPVGELRSAGVPVDTIAFGDDADHAMLAAIAEQTGGRFCRADPGNLAGVLWALWSAQRRLNTIASITGVIHQDEALRIPVSLALTVPIEVCLRWPGSELSISLEHASGSAITGGLQVTDRGRTYITARAPKLPAGDYRFVVYGKSVEANSEQFNLDVLSAMDDGVFVYPMLSSYARNRPVDIRLAVSTSAAKDLTVTVVGPTGRTEQLAELERRDTPGNQTEITYRLARAQEHGFFKADVRRGQKPLAAIMFAVGRPDEMGAYGDLASHLDLAARRFQEAYVASPDDTTLDAYALSRILGASARQLELLPGLLDLLSANRLTERDVRTGSQRAILALEPLIASGLVDRAILTRAGQVLAGTVLPDQLASLTSAQGPLVERVAPTRLRLTLPLDPLEGEFLVLESGARPGTIAHRFRVFGARPGSIDWARMDAALDAQSNHLMAEVLAELEHHRQQKGVVMASWDPLLQEYLSCFRRLESVTMHDRRGLPYYRYAIDTRPAEKAPAGAVKELDCVTPSGGRLRFRFLSAPRPL